LSDADPSRRAPWLMLGASFQFALMGVCVKLASSQYGAGELVMYRSLIGAGMIALLVRWRGGTLRTSIPGMHAWRAAVGVASLVLWFTALGGSLPLATAMTLNYMSSVWMALFLIGGAIAAGGSRVDSRLVATVLVGFAGVALVLRPSIDQQQLWHGFLGLLSGVMAALAYLQVTA
jgi:drug/metabolite transporter (DMT)-like permease